jgi:hypothetical protein
LLSFPNIPYNQILFDNYFLEEKKNYRPLYSTHSLASALARAKLAHLHINKYIMGVHF